MPPWSVLARKHDSGVEKRPRDSGCDGYQVALAVEDLYLWSARHFRQIHGAAGADEGGAFFVGGDARQLRDQLSGMDEQGLGASLLHRGFERSELVGVFECELGDGGPSQGGQMSAAAEHPAHLLTHRSYVCARGDARTEGGLIARSVQNLEFFNFYLHRFELDLLLFAR